MKTEARVVKVTFEARASEIAKEIMRSGDVAKSRATLIARTEVARTARVLTQARAEQAVSAPMQAGSPNALVFPGWTQKLSPLMPTDLRLFRCM